jgi:hypothetical protein
VTEEDAGADEAVICLVCGRRIVLMQDSDGTITLPDAEAFRRDHADCLKRADDLEVNR